MKRGTPSRSFAVLLVFATGSSFVPRRVFADDAETNKAIATDLFDKGVAKMSEGHCDEEKPTKPGTCRDARESFRRAYELYPGALGALRNLAYVEKGLGLVASAAHSFRELARKAPLDPKPERQKWADFAREEAAKLAPRVPHLTIKVPTDRPLGTKITLDGVALSEGAWNTAIDVDPGDHAVHAEAPGRFSFDGSVNLAEKQDKTIPVALDVDTRVSDAAKNSSRRTLPLIVATVGLVGVAAGLGLGYASMKKKDDACGGTKLCDPDGLSQGKSLANASTIVTGISAAVLVGGLVWFFVTPSSSDKDRSTAIAPYVGPGGGGVAAIGRF